MNQWVDISFDCLPLRSVGRLDIPLDASPKYRQRCERIKRFLEKHGSHNTYYLYNAGCAFHLTNRPEQGSLEFRFDGTVITDAADMRATAADLEVELIRETCDWLTAPVVQWFAQSVQHAVCVEFDRYIEAGDLAKTKARMERLQAELEKTGGHVGMYL
ncbi:MAG TPA: hypothetical protein VFB80_16620 [Pirellulaceae bacterium]|nr:hypothetical protein [Pirellulaceae bacterium]